MPVTFGTVQLVPAIAPAPASGQPSKHAGGPPRPPDPRDLAPVLQQLHDRAARVRAH
jgi:hypothetical protein